MLMSAISKARQFKRDEKGSIAILFGFSSIAVCLMLGLSIDLGRVYSSHAKIAAAADAAALAAAKGIRLEGLSDEQAIALAQQVFTENMRDGSGRWTDVHSVNVDIDRATSKATVNVDSSVKSTFAVFSGISSFRGPGSATALFESRDVEVGVQLDLTGSMKGAKIEALKDATKSLVDSLIPENPNGQKVRVGFAPFSAGVNVGPYLRNVNDNRASANSCVYERFSNADTDAAPIANDSYKIRSDLTGKSIQDCPTAQIVPLTSDRTLLKAQVDTFTTGGSTAGQLGASWAWNLVSPNFKNVWPAASEPVEYGTPNTDKFVILMTDGEYNTIGGIQYGSGSAQELAASNKSVDICTNMKEAGITVYTVGFKLNVQLATDTLKACAGRKGNPYSEDFFYRAEDAAELKAAFNNIANAIMRLHLTN